MGDRNIVNALRISSPTSMKIVLRKIKEKVENVLVRVSFSAIEEGLFSKKGFSINLVST